LPIIDSSLFGPVMSIAKPNFPLHALCTIWQPMPDPDFARMVESARRMGGIFNDPATVWEGQILDGRHRQAVCQKVGCKFEYREFRGDYATAREWVLVKNFNRRHMSVSQRAMMVTSLAECDTRASYGSGTKAAQVAQVAQVAKSTAQQAIKLKRTGDELAIERVLKGESTLSKELKEKRKEARAVGVDDKTAMGLNIRRRDRVDFSDDMYQDATGKVIPPSLQEVWRVEGMFSAFRDRTERMMIDIKQLKQSPAGWAISDSYIMLMADMSRDFANKRPHYICPHCNGGFKCDCKLCKKKWLARGREDADACYCCDGHGFLLKDEPYPTPEWVREVIEKESEDDAGRVAGGSEECCEVDGLHEGGTGGGVLRPEGSAATADEELPEVDTERSADRDDDSQEEPPSSEDDDYRSQFIG